jgi:hypothetical protein
MFDLELDPNCAAQEIAPQIRRDVLADAPPAMRLVLRQAVRLIDLCESEASSDLEVLDAARNLKKLGDDLDEEMFA